MSLRRSPPSASDSRPASPYAHQRHGKSKKREQFSACGACRMRRVRCDLKDLPLTTNGHPACSNCRERGLNCIDEFADVKAVKLLRRGRRLQQVEAVYGKINPEDASVHHAPPPPAVIPKLRKEFFDSPFFRRFHVQKPILEPMEYRERYLAHLDGNPDCLPIPGQLIAMALVVWAATFGVDEYGQVIQEEDPHEFQQRAELVNEMLQEMLYLVDLHGIIRKPTWDGVKLLLLLLPLTQEVQSPIERLVMHEATLSQIHALCAVVPTGPSNSGQDEYLDAIIRARIFWYGHMLDGVTNGLRGGRLLLDDDDLAVFDSTLPTRNNGSKMFAAYASVRRLFSIPLQISSVCRQIHACLTGSKARRMDTVNTAAITNAWDTLDRCWKELDDLSHWSIEFEYLETEEINRFVHGWQIYIFECYNVIRENIKQRITPHTTQGAESGIDRRSIDLVRLYENAKLRCDTVVRSVVLIIQQNLPTDFFRYDACQVRDGCFFAAFVLANDSGSKEDVDVCLQALSQMRWIFSKSDERMNTLRMVWESRVRNESPNPPDHSSIGLDLVTNNNYSDVRRHPPRTLSVPPLALIPPHDAAGLSQSAPTTAYSEDGRWPSMSSDSRTLPAATHGALSSHLGSPLIVPQQHHSPRYRNVSQPLPQLGTPLMSSSNLASSSLLSGPLGSPSSHSLSFTRPPEQQPAYYMPASSYDYYEEASGSTSTDHAQSSSDSNHTPTPPVRYQPSQYFSDTVGGYSVNEGSPGALHHHQSPAAPDETGGGSFF